MEFLFLNESAGFGDDSSAYKSMVTFAESQGVDITEDVTKSLTEVMLEAEEGFHEAEMAAMREEFALYQESVQNEDNEVFQEGFLEKVGQKLKQWWKAIKEFIIRLWGKIVHAFWVGVQWARKTIQTAIQKIHGSTSIWVPKSLEAACRGGVEKADKLQQLISDCADGIFAKLQYEKNAAGDAYIVKIKDFEKAVSNISAGFSQLKEQVKKDVEGKKMKLKVMNKNGALKNGAEYKGSMVQIPFSTWKKWMDDSLKTFENAKKAADKANSQMKKAVSDCDKEIEKAYKAGKDADVKVLRRNASALRMGSTLVSKMSSTIVSTCRWVMGALFHYSSVKAGKEAKSVEV